MTNFRSIAAMTVIAACIAAPFVAQRFVVQSLIEPEMMSRTQLLVEQAHPVGMMAAAQTGARD